MIHVLTVPSLFSIGAGHPEWPVCPRGPALSVPVSYQELIEAEIIKGRSVSAVCFGCYGLFICSSCFCEAHGVITAGVVPDLQVGLEERSLIQSNEAACELKICKESR